MGVAYVELPLQPAAVQEGEVVPAVVHMMGGRVVLVLLHVVLFDENAQHRSPDCCRCRHPLSKTVAAVVEQRVPKVSAQS